MRKKKILVVDDESGFTRLMKIALSHYEIQEENDSQRAIETALKFRPDLILLDVIMPGLDGGDLAAQISEHVLLRNIPIVFLTAIVSPGETGKASRLIGGYPFLAKPVSAAALERCIEENLAEA
jgi:two-component system, OmpR family, response regulator